MQRNIAYFKNMSSLRVAALIVLAVFVAIIVMVVTFAVVDMHVSKPSQRTVEVRQLKVIGGRARWFGAGASAFAVRDTASGGSWLVLQLHPDLPGIVLPQQTGDPIGAR